METCPWKQTEVNLLIQPIQMGARVYIPELGRFLQVDPVEGGTFNNYTYVQDPINQTDLNGEFAFLIFGRVLAQIAWAALRSVIPIATGYSKATPGRPAAARPSSVPRVTPRPSAPPSPTAISRDAQRSIQYLRTFKYKSPPMGQVGGRYWENRLGQLPNSTPAGQKIIYKEWDTVAKIRGTNRSAERIITGNDGSIWYTTDHYKSIVNIEKGANNLLIY